jgi:hypothetical protein
VGTLRSVILLAALIASVASLPGTARASTDLEREIQALRATANDMEALDTERRVRDDIGVLRAWLDEAWNQQARGSGESARRTLTLCVAQTDLIRQRLAAVKAEDAAAKRRRDAAELRARIKEKRASLEEAKAKKAVLEATVK